LRNLTLTRKIKYFHGLFKSKTIGGVMVGLAVIGIFILILAVIDNSSLNKYTKYFIAKEKSIGKMFSDPGKYEQYLFVGYKVLYVPPMINLIFGVNDTDMSLRICLGKELIWKNIETGFYWFGDGGMPPSVFFFLMVMIFMFFAGMASYKRFSRLTARFGKAISRMIVLDLCIGLIWVSIYYSARLVGIGISSADGILGMYFVFYSLLLLNLFFAIGFFMGLCLKDKKMAMIIGAFFCFVMIFIAPYFSFKNIYKDLFDTDGNKFENMDIKRFGDSFKYINAAEPGSGEKKNKNGRTSEKPLIKEWRENIEWQNKAIETFKDRYYSYENQVIIVPTNFWLYLVNELTGRGVTGYLNFLDHGLQLKKDLVKEYNPEEEKTLIRIKDEKYKGPGKDDLYLYRDKGHIPDSFYQATLLTVYYTVILFLVSLLIALRQRRLRIKKSEKNKELLIKNARDYFYRSLGYSSSRVYIVLERDLAVGDTEIPGLLFHILIKSDLGPLFSKLNIRDFWSFYSAEPDKMAEFFNSKPEMWEEGEEPPTGDELWPEDWFSPAEGLVTVRTMIEMIKNNPEVFLNRRNSDLGEVITMKLRDMEEILSTAEVHGVRWHLEVGFHDNKENFDL
jgi:hypothetical protein